MSELTEAAKGTKRRNYVTICSTRGGASIEHCPPRNLVRASTSDVLMLLGVVRAPILLHGVRFSTVKSTTAFTAAGVCQGRCDYTASAAPCETLVRSADVARRVLTLSTFQRES